MTTADARALLAAGHVSLRAVARAWRVSMPDAYLRLYRVPMKPVATPPGGRVLQAGSERRR